jgi:hypothetical protein
MIFAAFGFISPAAGALIQEAFDVIVILNALRAVRACGLSFVHSLKLYVERALALVNIASALANHPHYPPINTLTITAE